ncbi:type I-E CRISPR-associated endoribonuclease Cas2e [Kitasatospora sp. NPDC094011]|uniref:type I-E CRISPR-associated endoribonuclease Cas2e n=1 Tax=Kitasatospora sp. NPDC094011 TaxID=3364090 RepID=UPI0037F5E1F2
MATMTVLSATAVPEHVRGALTRWLIEVTPQLYVGTLSAKVREELWQAVSGCVGTGVAVLIHTTANEQGFELRTAGAQRRKPVDFDGLTLVSMAALQAADGPNPEGK